MVVVALALVCAVAIVAASVLVPRALRDDTIVGGGSSSPTGGQGGGQGGDQGSDPGTRTGERIEGLQVYDDQELVPEHTTGPVDYPQTPPVGGPHDPVWLDCGVYDSPVRDENAVHDLEHGTVWITYDPDLDAADVDALAGRLPANGILSPYPGLDAAAGASVVLTVWGRQLALDDDPLDDPRLEQFLGQFGAGEASLEPFVSCQGGTSDPDGGTGSNA